MKSYKSLRAFFVFLSIVIFTATGFSLPSAHRYHTSLTRLDFNAQEKIFEISIRLFTHDLTQFLEQKTGKRIDLEKTPGIDQMIFNYVNENFVLKNRKEETKKLKFIGKELDIDAVLIYLETSSEDSPKNFTLQNTLFFESFPEQVNLVIANYEGKKADLLFKVGDKSKEIVENKPPE